MVHERVREHIRQMQVKQSWLAKRMYLSEGALSLILAGKRKMTVDELERLCAILCVPSDTFVRPEEVKLPAYLNTPMMCESFPWGWRGVPSLEGEE